MHFNKGHHTIIFEHRPVILSSACVVGDKEGKGPLKNGFNEIFKDAYMNQKDWESAESQMQKRAMTLALDDGGYLPEDIEVIFAGDLLEQTTASTFGLMNFKIPIAGIYSACANIGEALGLCACMINGHLLRRSAAVTSSHYAGAEKAFRYPLNYANQRPLCNTWTVTGAAAFIVGEQCDKNKNEICISSWTIGTIVDYGIKDAMNMGACMAPAAAKTLVQLFKDTHSTADDYDMIFTGDLGNVGQKILFELMGCEGYDIQRKHKDCGLEIYNITQQDVHAGGSGCACSAVVLSAYILPMMKQKKWKKIIFLPTGALLSKTTFQEGKSIPGIAHGLVLECCNL